MIMGEEETTQQPPTEPDGQEPGTADAPDAPTDPETTDQPEVPEVSPPIYKP